jgi:hypothetical protein
MPGPGRISRITCTNAGRGLVVLPNGNLACLFEAGVESPYEGIVFKELSFKDFEK